MVALHSGHYRKVSLHLLTIQSKMCVCEEVGPIYQLGMNIHCVRVFQGAYFLRLCVWGMGEVRVVVMVVGRGRIVLVLLPWGRLFGFLPQYCTSSNGTQGGE